MSALGQTSPIQFLNWEGRCIDEIDSVSKLATGIAYNEESQSIPEDFQEAAHILNGALETANL